MEHLTLAQKVTLMNTLLSNHNQSQRMTAKEGKQLLKSSVKQVESFCNITEVLKATKLSNIQNEVFWLVGSWAQANKDLLMPIKNYAYFKTIDIK